MAGAMGSCRQLSVNPSQPGRIYCSERRVRDHRPGQSPRRRLQGQVSLPTSTRTSLVLYKFRIVPHSYRLPEESRASSGASIRTVALLAITFDGHLNGRLQFSHSPAVVDRIFDQVAFERDWSTGPVG